MAAARHHRSSKGLFDQRSLTLDAPRAQPQAVTAPVLKRLWFCIYLPNLALEASGPGDEARVVVEEQHGIHRVLLASAKAASAGILPGQSANAALALLPALRVEPRNEVVEQQALEHLSSWLERFTSVVCFAGPDVLLLEIAGSLRLYGGLLSLRQQIAAGLEQQGFSASLAIAPTPLAATWLAKGGRRACIREPANLTAALRNLPLACLDWPSTVGESLTGMGVRSIGDCLRLPREGFARRFGPQRLIELDRALGRLPDPRSSWRAPERFCADYEMTEEQSDRELLLAICRELLLSLERFLLTRQLGVQSILFTFFHLRNSATQLRLGCANTERLTDRWFDLLRIRFEKLTLPEPVISVRLRAGHAQALRAEPGRLRFQGTASGQGQKLRFSVAQLAERLVARVGNESVAGVMTVAEHRPQFAWRSQVLLSGKAVKTLSTIKKDLRRPLWMLPEPALLPVDAGYPLHQGRLRILEGPERLETGWWDEDGIMRDYYTAVNPRGMRLWVFRNRNRTASWYLHGFFG
jgi:protein ImuB